MSIHWGGRGAGHICRGSGSGTFADDLLALDFKNGRYRYGSNFIRTLSALPGYAFTDSVDNLPNIDASGYTALSAESSKLSFTSPIAGDASFLWWVVVNLLTTAASSFCAGIDDGSTNNRFYLQTSSAGRAQANTTTGGSSMVVSSLGSTPAVGRQVIMMERTQGGNTAVHHLSPSGVVTLGPRTAVTAPASGMTKLRIGVNSASTAYANCAAAFVGMKLGTFSDAEITALLLGT